MSARSDRSAVVINLGNCTIDALALDPLGEEIGGQLAATAQRLRPVTSLAQLRSVDISKAENGFAYFQRVAVGDVGSAGDCFSIGRR